MQKTPTQKIAEKLSSLYSTEHTDRPENVLWNYPAADQVVKALKILIRIMFPGLAPASESNLEKHFEQQLDEVSALLGPEIERAVPFRWQSAAMCNTNPPVLDDVPAETVRILNAFLRKLPFIREMLIDDVKAAYNGDPAALSYAEVKVAYPGVLAIASHRIAHELYSLDVPIIPRVMNEWTHAKAGIDIHPGATIDRGFFIDHGTGVVIGETANIGKDVKIYQGVTLGAKSFPLDEHGNPIKHIQRHPTVEDNVIIYSNTTVLGGKTVLGHDSVIGGNVFLMDSVPPHSFVTKTGEGASVRTKDTTHLLGGLGI
ncbi:serine O-acetyltransferase EpsC [Tichowtungia aerotolerans]|uniref:Serine acetyltransferase n=1 Tax=Tichowtungia aerotolerans TaxID=2697043 RepID=A0A6P1ME99_9BACT|nr:serine O-acetyltransferase EpsC [Tichowtungia aerotolerans]QHI69926.1 serine acetyltransferase [Tichowtungia aerotolerans]